MSAAIAPNGTYGYDKDNGIPGSEADELCEDEKFSDKTEALMAMDLKTRETYIVIFQTRDHEENMVKVRATDAGRAQMLFEKAYTGAMLTKEDLTSNEATYMSPYRWNRKAGITILTEEEFGMRQAS